MVNRKNLLSLVIRHISIGLTALVMIGLISCGTEISEESDSQESLLKETDQPIVAAGSETETSTEKLSSSTITIDATNQENWTYFSFEQGQVVEIPNADVSKDWDLAFQRTKVKINGGVSGPGNGEVVMLTETTFDSVAEALADGYEKDTADTLAIVPQSKKGWYVYTGVPTHWVLPIEDRVFVFKTATGSFAKVQFFGCGR